MLQLSVLNIELVYLWSWKVQFGSYFQRTFSFIKQLVCFDVWKEVAMTILSTAIPLILFLILLFHVSSFYAG